MWKEYLEVINKRSKAILNGDVELEVDLDRKIKKMEQMLTKEDIEMLLKQPHNYLSKIHWSNQLKEKK